MKWTEFNIHTNQQSLESITGLLLLEGIEGTQIIDKVEDSRFLRDNVNKGNYADYVEDILLNPPIGSTIIRFYLNETDIIKYNYFKSSLNSKPEILKEVYKIETKKCQNSDWENEWKSHFKPIHIGKNIVIVPVWETYINNQKIIFIIEPGHLFGTGLHESTQQSIVKIEKYAKNATVLDIGCGTGILSIISLLCGAKHATAVDIELTAEVIVSKNATLNKVEKKIDVHIGNLLQDKYLSKQLLSKNYNLIIVNIVADVIIAMLYFITKALDGIFIVAGIIKERKDDVTNALLLHKFNIISINYTGNWVCIVSERYNI